MITPQLIQITGSESVVNYPHEMQGNDPLLTCLGFSKQWIFRTFGRSVSIITISIPAKAAISMFTYLLQSYLSIEISCII